MPTPKIPGHTSAAGRTGRQTAGELRGRDGSQSEAGGRTEPATVEWRTGAKRCEVEEGEHGGVKGALLPLSVVFR